MVWKFLRYLFLKIIFLAISLLLIAKCIFYKIWIFWFIVVARRSNKLNYSLFYIWVFRLKILALMQLQRMDTLAIIVNLRTLQLVLLFSLSFFYLVKMWSIVLFWLFSLFLKLCLKLIVTMYAFWGLNMNLNTDFRTFSLAFFVFV